MLAVSLGPLNFTANQLLLLGALCLALLVGAIAGRKQQIPVSGVLVDTLVAGFLFARIGFVAQYFEHYQDNLWGIFNIRDGGFDLLSGILGALGYSVFLIWRTPMIRGPFVAAIAAGLLSWGSVSAITALIHHQTSTLPTTPLTTLENTTVTLPGLAEGQRPMVVNLWASWCPPCVREMPVLAAAQQNHPDIEVVFVNQGEQPESIRQFLRQHNLSLENLLVDSTGELGRLTGSQVLPTTLFYSADGRQIDAHIGELSHATLARALDRLARQSL